jgi:hypothetical protein
VIEVKKKILGFAFAFVFLAMLTIPVFAEKPTLTYTLTASHVPTGPGYMDIVFAGESGNSIFILKDWLCVFTGDITGVGYYTGIVLDKSGVMFNSLGYWTFDEVTLEGVGTGGLRIGCRNTDIWIESGSGELSSIRGRGTALPVLELTVYINP